MSVRLEPGARVSGVNQSDVASLLRLAQYAASTTGTYLVQQRPVTLQQQIKTSATDVATQMDHAAESLLVDLLLTHRPDDSLLGEEGALRSGSSPITWVVDPIDGTTNYVYDLPMWAVSVAAQRDGRSVVGVVDVPVMGMSFWAAAGQGAWMLRNGRTTRLKASSISRVDHALVATGFGYAAATRADQGRSVQRLLPLIRDIRRAGAASIDLCWVASGAVDAYFEKGLQPWDHAAGGLIAREAGAVVDGLWTANPNAEMTFASAPGIASGLRSVLVQTT